MKRKYPSKRRPYQLPRQLTNQWTSDLLSSLSDAVPKEKYLRQVFLSKYADPDPALKKQRRDLAIQKFMSVEHTNELTNLRLMNSDILDGDRMLGRSGVTISAFTELVRMHIKSVIGSRPPLEILTGSFSGGASTSLRRSPGQVACKFSGRPDVTPQAWDTIWPMIYKDHDLWHHLNPEVLNPRFVDGNVMFTVPKNDTIDRVACKEPDLNMWIQKAAGDFIRSRLRKRAKIDLNDQSINRGLARAGSLSRKLATLDLSSASDSVTVQLVIRLLPFEWYAFLDAIRSQVTTLPDGTKWVTDLFSTMGNGFTFELESLIFWALTQSVLDLCPKEAVRSISVFGDDIICPAWAFGLMRTVLNYHGFTLNKAKSFGRGPFRESCGGHYHNGVDVSPFFLRGPLKFVPDLIHQLNQLRDWASTGTWCDDDFYDLWKKYSNFVPHEFHGGIRLDDKSSLVSPTGKGFRLLPKTLDLRRKSDRFDTGLYLHWHRTALTRTLPVEQSASVEVELPDLVKRPGNRSALLFGMTIPLFPREIA